MARALAFLLLALVLSFGTVACGEDSNSEFKGQYNEAVRPLSRLGDDVVASLTGAGSEPDRKLADRLDNYADRAERARKNLSKLEPPEDTTDQFDDLLAALKHSVADLRALAASAKEGDPAKVAEATQELVKSGQRLQRAESSFRRAVEG